jgi:IPT/TIG domain
MKLGFIRNSRKRSAAGGREFVYLLLLCISLASASWAQAPRIFYSDLESGPNTGGQNNKGAFVTIYGKGFGNARGSSLVTIGGQHADNYPIWTDTKVAFQLGTTARTGDIVVHVPGRGDSNGVPFMVRPGKIYFVSPSGGLLGRGGYTSPWKTIDKAAFSLGPGDIAYVMNGVVQSKEDNYDAALSIQSAGAPGRPKALVAYPGANPVIGTVDGPDIAIRTPDIEGGPFSHWVIAGFTLRGHYMAFGLVSISDWRIVGNDISCPRGDGPTACVEVAKSTYVKVLGNSIHDVGRPHATKVYHSLYFSTDSNHIEAGWNVIANNHSCRGIQFFSGPNGPNTGFNQYDLIVHDNIIHDQVCDGINFATIDPSKGPVLAYNNIVYRVGLGPDPPDGEANYTCINSPGTTNRGAPGSGTAEWFNNTLYDCGTRSGRLSGAFNVAEGSPPVRLRNNIVYLKSSENYLEYWTRSSLVSGSNNLWFGSGRGPSQFNGNLNVDPKFADLGAFDFHLQAGSPAIHAGVDTGVATDLDGRPRNHGLGAFEPVEPTAAATASARAH